MNFYFHYFNIWKKHGGIQLKGKLKDLPLIQFDISTILDNDLNLAIAQKCYKNIYNDRYDEWGLYSDPKLLSTILEALYLIVDDFQSYNLLASLGSSGAPLTFNLSVRHEKKAIFINDDWGITPTFQPIKPQNIIQDLEKDTKILLIDSIFKSGLTTYNAICAIEKYMNTQNVSIGILVISVLPKFVELNIFNSNQHDIPIYYLTSWDVESIEKALNNHKTP